MFLNCILYLTAIGALSFVAGRLLPKSLFHHDRFPFRKLAFEHNGRLYERLCVRKWKDALPDMSKILPNIMLSKHLSPDLSAPKLVRMIQETCVAEWTHALLCVLGFGCVLIWHGAFGWMLAMLFALGNLPYIIIQRYNRPRLLRILHAIEKTEIKRSAS